MPFFSIITINLNDAIGLNKTVESVISQSFTDFEYIVIDGASTDGSVDVIKNYQDKISYWISEKDSGIYDAMNKGIAFAKGEYLLFLNSGDCLYANDVLQTVSEFRSFSDLIYGDLLLAQNSSIVGIKKYPDKISSIFLYLSCIVHQAQFINRALFEKHGNYSTEYKICSDYDFFIKLYFQMNLTTTHIPIPVTVYDISGISSNPSNVEKIYKERKLIQKIYFPKITFLAFSGCEAIFRSRLWKNSLATIPLKYLTKIILKIFKAN